MLNFEVGKVEPAFVGHPESTMFDIDQSGSVLYVFFDSPTEKDVQQFSAESRFEIRYAVIDSCIDILVKFGDLNWMDAPFSPHLSKSDNISNIDDGQGLALVVVFADGRTGTVKALRLIGLGTNFSRALRDEINDQLRVPFDEEKYNETQIKLNYFTIKKLLERSSHYYKI
jgi:hypothetical protein